MKHYPNLDWIIITKVRYFGLDKAINSILQLQKQRQDAPHKKKKATVIMFMYTQSLLLTIRNIHRKKLKAD